METRTLRQIVNDWYDDESYYNHPLARKCQIIRSVKELMNNYPFLGKEEIKNTDFKTNFILFIYNSNNEMIDSKVVHNIDELLFSKEEYKYKIYEDDDWNLLLVVSACLDAYNSFQERLNGYNNENK